MPSQAAEIRLDELDLAHGALRLPRRTVYLDTLTGELLTQWLRMRQQTWPACSNPHLLVSSQTALDPSARPSARCCSGRRSTAPVSPPEPCGRTAS
ncbi:hypothetical protein [Streptomyces mirabilis]|uniref:hypothetical protein n=1 Tax=Streptomyces mirabilis TaxID=68239 RepID=UPI00369DDE01